MYGIPEGVPMYMHPPRTITGGELDIAFEAHTLLLAKANRAAAFQFSYKPILMATVRYVFVIYNVKYTLK